MTTGERVLADWIAAETAGTDSTLDVGTGPGKFLRHSRSRLLAGLDVQPPGFGHIRLQGDALEVMATLGTGSYDVVMSTDFLEHLEKPESRHALAEMYRIARRKILVFTPDGFAPQHPGMPGAERFTPEEWRWQTHRCGWTRAELQALGYSVAHWPWGWSTHPPGGVMATKSLIP